MSLEIVNGYVCRTCSDVDLAKRGVDPADPSTDPRKADFDPDRRKAEETKPGFGPAVRSGEEDARTARNDRYRADRDRDDGRPRPTLQAGQGTTVDLYA